MKKFTLLLVFVLSSMIVMSQNMKPVVEKLWDHSIAGTADWSTGVPIGGEAPTWMGNTTERSMDAYDGKVYVMSRKNNPPEILVLDGETGNLVETIAVDTAVVKGGIYNVNCLKVTKSGKIIITNLATNSSKHPFKAYVVEKDNNDNYTFTTLIEYMSVTGDSAAYRIGDGMSFYGDVSTQEDGYLITANSNGDEGPVVLRWDIKAGVADSVAKVITASEVYPAPEDTKPNVFGISPNLSAVDNDLFWIDGHATYPTLYNMDGDLLTSFKGDKKPQLPGVSGVKQFTFKERDFMLAPSTNWAKEPKNGFQLFEIPTAGLEEADSIAFIPENGLGPQKNTSFAYPVSVDVMENHVNLYMMCANNGIAAYKLTLEDNSAADFLTDKDQIQMYPNPTSGQIQFNRTLEKLSIYSMSGQLIFEKSNVNRVNVTSPAGNYIVNAIDQKGNSFKKILIVQ